MIEVLHNIFWFIAVISVLVFVHEFGHYWVAKKLGVKIESFSIGMGKELFGWNDKAGTRWKLSLLPIGGYVKMYGDENAASVPDSESKFSAAEKKMAFQFQPLLNRTAIVFAGPLINFILAILFLTFLFTAFGKPTSKPIVKEVQASSPAEQAGIVAGDVILKLNNHNIKEFKDIVGVVNLFPNQTMQVVFNRNGEIITSLIKPVLVESNDAFGKKAMIAKIGIVSEPTYRLQMNVFSALTASVAECYDLSSKTLTALWQIITFSRSADQISGVLRIADYSGKSAEMGIATLIWFMAVLSLNLALVNLFPIPGLDGGHLFLYLVEFIKGKPINEKYLNYVFKAGFSFLIFLMLLATFNDLKYFQIL
jgi:regulator of sigma E protease